MKAGEPVTADNVRSIRPAGGLEPEAFSRMQGRTFRTDVVRGTALSWELV
ncbi:SAF domain-containing protein [Luteipulveratus sp. YIM 133132]|nr:SAF domain-containing protein [Luteipulveratus sp. YIM 133132]MDE9366713.1 SAF domain-containing protein [Luteipulveratus sp. YIM 133132]